MGWRLKLIAYKILFCFVLFINIKMREFTAKFCLMLLLLAVPNVLAQGQLSTSDITARPYRDEMKASATWVFNLNSNTHREKTEFEGASLIGVSLGFACTGIFLIIAASLIIYDEVKRHKTYEALI